MKSIAVLGGGKLGTSLGRALISIGYPVKAVSCRHFESAQESAALIGDSVQPFTDNPKAVSFGKWIFLTVPDDEISTLVKELSHLNLKGKLVCHCSGILSAEVLNPLKKQGAYTASLHPVQTFSSRECNPVIFQNIFFTLEGEDKACSRLKDLVEKFGGIPLEIQKDQKPGYHASCSLSSNLLIALIQTAASLLKPLSTNGKEYRILLPLIRQTLNNIEEKGLSESLTGPVVRGDLQTVKIHLASLRKNPQAYHLYRNLAGRVLETAAARISPDKYQILKDWLKDT